MQKDAPPAAAGPLDEFQLRDELRALRTQIPDSPALNPIVSLAFDLSRQLEAGDISFEELKALAGGKVITEDEFAAAKQTKVRGFAQQFESYSRVGDQIERLWAVGLPMTELQHEYDEVAKATLPAALAAAKLHARPDRASMILVGDRTKIEGKVRDLKVGDIVVVDGEGKAAR
jgi:predicted Zn-dependent peptidase